MINLANFLLAFFFSFIGTIPPGSINLSIIQLGLEKKINIAWRLALAAAIVEYPYAWLAITFEKIITASPVITDNLQLITAVVMVLLGLFNLISLQKPSAISVKFNQSGFRRGFVLGLLNPLALPFWVGTTAYLRSQQWIDLSTGFQLHAYLLGVSLGALVMLMLFAFLAKRMAFGFQHYKWIKKIPGITLLLLGIYAFVNYLF